MIAEFAPEEDHAMRSDLLLHVETGELIPAGEESLTELAERANELLGRVERDTWELGRVVSAARLRCEDRACGVEGPNADARFGRWCVENFNTPESRFTIRNARRLWSVFGERQSEVEFIPQSALYMLAEPKCDAVREDLIDELRESGNRVRVIDIRDAVKRMTSERRQARSGVVSIEQSKACTVDDLGRLIEKGKQFSTIYADPPWQYGNQGTRAATENHYSGLSVEELMQLPIRQLAAPNAHLHLWTTNAFLFDCQRIMEAWGFEYRSCFVWVKPQMGLGNYWRVSHEFMLFGLRGKSPFLSRSEMSWGEYPRSIHSRKPEEVRKKIEKVSPGPYLELFGRMPVRGWTVWGNQIAKDMLDIAEVVNE